MDIKKFLASPESSMASLGISVDGSKGRELLEQVDQLTQLRSRLKEAKKNKSEVARQFKAPEQAADERESLILAMQVVSAEIKGIEEELKTIEKRMADALNANQQQDTPLPPFVIAPEQHYNGGYTVRELRASERHMWEEFLLAAHISAYHHPVWAELIRRSFGHPTRIWVAINDEGKLIGGVPLTFFSSRLFGRFAVSIPYFNYGGVISSWFNVARDIVGHLKTICKHESLSHIEIRSMQPNLGEHFSSKKVSMVLSLPDSEASLDEQLGAKVRAQYKKSEEYQPKIVFGKMELLDDFYRVFAHNMRDLGTPVYGKKWFANILSESKINAVVAVAYVNQKPVATGFLIGHEGMLEIPWASTIRQANAMNVNMWMYRQILGYAVNEGYQFFDFGRSTRDAGTFKFKKQWGAVPHTHYWYYLFPEGGAVPELNPDNPKYKLMINLWKKMPVWLSKLIGPPIVANLP